MWQCLTGNWKYGSVVQEQSKVETGNWGEPRKVIFEFVEIPWDWQIRKTS